MRSAWKHVRLADVLPGWGFAPLHFHSPRGVAALAADVAQVNELAAGTVTQVKLDEAGDVAQVKLDEAGNVAGVELAASRQ